MFNIHQAASRWLRHAVRAAEGSRLEFYKISPIFSNRMDEWLNRYGYEVKKDIIVTSRFEEAEVFIGKLGEAGERVFLCLKPYVPTRPTEVFQSKRRTA